MLEGSCLWSFQESLSQIRKSREMLLNIVLPNRLVQLLNLPLVNSLIRPRLLHHLPLLLIRLNLQLNYLLRIPRVIEVRNRVPLLSCAHHSVRSRLVQSLRHLLQHVPNIYHKITWNRVDIHPLIFHILCLQTLLRSHQNRQKTIIAVLSQWLSIGSFCLRDVRVVEDSHQAEMVFAE